MLYYCSFESNRHTYLQKGKLIMKKKQWFKRILILLLVTILCLPDIPILANSVTSNENMQNTASLDSENMQVKASNSFGKILQNSLTEYENNENSSPNSILDIEMSGKTANVTLKTTQSCTVFVGIYSEDGTQLIASGEKEVTENDTNVKVTIATDNMPTYYSICASLISSELGRPLSEEYTNPMYTKDMQELMDKTVDDFDEEKVLNLDNDKTNNFAVYNDSVKIIKPTENYNTVVNPDSKSGTYTIENIDSQISNLKKGDTFSYEYKDNEFLIVKIDNIDIDATTAIITEDTTVETEDIFSVMKIDTQADASSATVDTSTASEFVTYEGMSNRNGQMKASAFSEKISASATLLDFSFEKDKDKTLATNDPNSGTGGDPYDVSVTAKISGGVSLALNLNLEYYISFSKQYLQFDITTGTELKIEAEAALDARIPLGYIGISPVPGVYIALEPALDFKIEGKIAASCGIEASLGFRYDSSASKKFQLISPEPDVTFPTLEVEAKVFVGIDLTPSLTIVSEKIAKAEATGTIGLNITATLSKSIKSDDSIQHSCKACVEGNISVGIELGANVTLAWDIVSVEDSTSFSFNISDFYWSIDNLKFGWGSCPYKKYRVNITFQDEDGTLLANKNFHMSGITAVDQPDYVTDSKGVYTAYYEPEKYSATLSMTGYSDGNVNFTIEDEAQDVTVILKKEDKEEDKNTETADGIPINATNFPDANFRQFILESVDYDENKYLSTSEINETTVMAVTSLNISNLKGIEYFTALTYLDCGNNHLTSLDVSKNTNLSILACYQNNLSNLNVSSNSKLTELDCYENNLQSLNVSSNSNLEQLWCFNNNLSSLDISSNTKLIDLSCSGNSIKTLDIRKNPNLIISGCDEDVEIIDNDSDNAGSTSVVKMKNISKASTNGLTTATYDNLSPNKKYMYYVFAKNAEYGEKITADKVIYAKQITPDKAGRATISHVANANAGITKLVSEDAIAITDTTINAQSFVYDGSKKTATLSLSYGKYNLTEGIDFTVSGDTTAYNAGTYTVTITGMGEFTGTTNATYQITPNEATPIAISSIKITGITKKVAAGKKTTLSATVLPKNCSNKEVNWATSNTKYATVNKNGIITTKTAGAGKTVTITATAKDGSGIVATYKIKIVKHAVKKITLKTKKTVNAGKKITIKATVKTTGKTANKTLAWTSSNTKFATVNKKGVVSTKKAGAGKTVTITATATDGSKKKAKIKIKIK